MTVGVLGRRYASALLELATSAGKVDGVARDLRDFAASFHDSRELRAAFENPSVSAQARKQILRDVAGAAGMDPLVRDALMLVSDRGRMSHLPEIVASYEALAAQRSGRLRAEVVTATELPEAYFAELQRTLERVTGKAVTIDRRVDPSILGGVVARIGDKVFDGSVKHRLGELEGELAR